MSHQPSPAALSARVLDSATEEERSPLSEYPEISQLDFSRVSPRGQEIAKKRFEYLKEVIADWERKTGQVNVAGYNPASVAEVVEELKRHNQTWVEGAAKGNVEERDFELIKAVSDGFVEHWEKVERDALQHASVFPFGRFSRTFEVYAAEHWNKLVPVENPWMATVRWYAKHHNPKTALKEYQSMMEETGKMNVEWFSSLLEDSHGATNDDLKLARRVFAPQPTLKDEHGFFVRKVKRKVDLDALRKEEAEDSSSQEQRELDSRSRSRARVSDRTRRRYGLVV